MLLSRYYCMTPLKADLSSAAVEPIMNIMMTAVTGGLNNAAITWIDFHGSWLRIPQEPVTTHHQHRQHF